MNRVRGELLLRLEQPDDNGAEDAYKRAIEIARNQLARTFELRAALSLSKLYHRIGRTENVRDLLEPALVGFNAGPEFPEVAAAKQLLAELHGNRSKAVIVTPLGRVLQSRQSNRDCTRRRTDRVRQ